MVSPVSSQIALSQVLIDSSLCVMTAATTMDPHNRALNPPLSRKLRLPRVRMKIVPSHRSWRFRQNSNALQTFLPLLAKATKRRIKITHKSKQAKVYRTRKTTPNPGLIMCRLLKSSKHTKAHPSRSKGEFYLKGAVFQTRYLKYKNQQIRA